MIDTHILRKIPSLHKDGANWRNKFNVLVPQADSFGAIAVIRSLGQHGYKTHAVSAAESALGFKSNFTYKATRSPAYYDPNYADWLRAYIRRHRIEAIIASEGFLLAIRNNFAEFSPLIPSEAPEEVIYRCLCKTEVFSSFMEAEDARLRENLPETLIIDTDSPIIDLSVINNWPTPVFIKGDGLHARNSQNAVVRCASSIEDIRRTTRDLSTEYTRLALSAYRPGRKAMVHIVRHRYEILAESMVLATHEYPHTGGTTSLRHSWWHDEIYQDAVMRLEHLNWDGPAMVEYRWDENSQSFAFIELNSRYWAALNLDILAGVHFPTLELDSFFGHKSSDCPIRYTGKIQVRNPFHGDFSYMLSRIRDKNVGLLSRLVTFAGFFLLFADPRIKSDLFYRGDRQLYFRDLWGFVTDLLRALTQRLIPSSAQSE